MPFDAIQRSFAAGEIAPALAGRADVTKYATGLRTCRNFLVQRYGGVTNRPGLEFIAEVRNSSKRSRVIPFIFNEDQTYVLEFSEEVIRVLRDGELLTTDTVAISAITAATPPEVTSVGHGLANGQAVLISGVVGMTQPNGRVYIVDNVTANTFELNNADGSFPQGATWDAYVSGGDADVVLEIESPYAEDDLFDIQYAQSADVVTLTCRGYSPRELRRLADDDWHLTELVFEPSIAAPTGLTATVGGAGSNTYDYQVAAISGNNNEESLPGSVTLAAANVSAISKQPFTFNAGALVFGGGRGGGSSSVTRTRYKARVTTGAAHGLNTGDSVTFASVGGMTELNGNHYKIDRISATVFDVRGPDVANWGAYTAGGTVTPTNKSLASAAVPTAGAPIVLTWSAVDGASEYHVFRSDAGSGVYGFIGTSRSTTYSDVNIAPDTTDTPRIPRNPFQGQDNHPGVCGYFQQRRIYASSNNAPETVWCSAVGDYNNLANRIPTRDNDAIVFGMVGYRVHEVRHVIDVGQLVILTSGGEWIAHGSSNGALTPTDINLKQYGHNGASKVQPVVISNTMLYVQARGSIVRDFRYQIETDGYSGRDLTIFSPHMFDGRTIVDWAYQEIPHSVVWTVRDDGALLGLTYVRDHDVWGWHRHDTDGEFESCCVVPEGNEDALYVVVNRTIENEERRFIERLHSRVVDDVAADAFFVDCGYTYDGRHAGGTLMNVNGAAWGVDDTQTLTANAATFAAADVGKAIRLSRSSTGETVRLTITGYTDTTHVSVRPNKTIPSGLRNQSITEWAFGITEITGLWWLEGKDVAILADGNVVSDGADTPLYTVTDGAITLPRHAFIAHIGLPFVSDLETLDLDMPDGETLLPKKKIVSKVNLLLDASRGGFVGPDEDHLTEFKQRQAESWDEPVALHTGPKEIRIESTWNQNGRIFVRQTDPLPMTILAAIPTVQLGGSV